MLMKTSELIEMLEDSLEINGDLEVMLIGMGTIYECIDINVPDEDSPLYIEGVSERRERCNTYMGKR